MKQEVREESEQEPDLVIDDTMDTEVKTEVREEQMEEPAANTIQSPGVAYFQAQKNLIRPKQESESTSRDPAILVDFADIALNHSKYSPEQRNSEESLPSPVEVDSVTAQPLDMTIPRVPAIMPPPPQVTTRPVSVTSVVTASGQPLRRLQPATAGQTIQYIPVPVQTRAPAPVMVIQGNGGHVPQTNGSAVQVLQMAQTPQVIRILPGGATMGMTV